MKETNKQTLEEMFLQCRVMADEPIEEESKEERVLNAPLTIKEAIERVASFNNETFDDVVLRRPRMVADNVMEDDEDVYLLPNSESHRNVYHIAKYRLGETDWEEHLNGKLWFDNQMYYAFKRIQKKIVAEKKLYSLA